MANVRKRLILGNDNNRDDDGAREWVQQRQMLEESKVEPVVMVTGRLQWVWQVKRRDKTENILAAAEIKMEGRSPRRPRLRWKGGALEDPG